MTRMGVSDKQHKVTTCKREQPRCSPCTDKESEKKHDAVRLGCEIQSRPGSGGRRRGLSLNVCTCFPHMVHRSYISASTKGTPGGARTLSKTAKQIRAGISASTGLRVSNSKWPQYSPTFSLRQTRVVKCALKTKASFRDN
jgi:hypothetical protein